MSDLTEKEQQLVFDIKIAGSLFYEYMQYYEPIYYKSFERQIVGSRKFKRQRMIEAKREFKSLLRTVEVFSSFMESEDEETFDKCLDIMSDKLKGLSKIIRDEKKQEA